MKNLNFAAFLETINISKESFASKTSEESAELYAHYLTDIAKNIEEAISNGATKDEIKSIQEEQTKAMADRSAKMDRVVMEQGKAIKSLMVKMNTPEATMEKSVLDHLKENSSKIEALKNGEKVNVRFTTKANMSLSANVTGQVPQAFRVDGVNNITTRAPRLLDIVSTGTIDSNLVEWVYQSNKTGTAGVTAEGAPKNQIAFDLIVASQRVEKVTAFIKVTDEMLSDASYMASEINNELTREVVKAAESQVYSGTGANNQLSGIKTTATAFAAGAFALAVDSANEVDVLVVAMNQILLAEHDPANYILMNPSDVTKLKMIKVSTSDKRYVERLAIVAGELSLDGTPIIATTLVPVGEYLVGNFALANVLVKDGLQIEIGLDADDFTKNLKTIRAEWRAVAFVKNNSRTAFVTGVFATDKAALETAA
jgi:HK97 family phage major capsid protein